MEEKEFQIENLVVRVLEHRSTSEEILYLSNWIKEEKHRIYFEQLKKLWNLTAGGHADENMFREGLEDYCRFMEASLKAKRRMRMLRNIASVAAILVIAFSSVLFIPKKEASLEKVGEISPLEGVVLRLADNQEIDLLQDTVSSIQSGNRYVKISKTDLRELVYEMEDSLVAMEEQELTYNQIIVPAGERFFVQLSDGTKVWINSESSLRFPTFFGKDQRCVEIRGNVYFEVAKDPMRPFVVESHEMQAKVLGTSFEMNTYGDRGKVTTTLVEGKVQVNVGEQSVVIKRNQQFVYDTRNGAIEVVKVNAAQKVRWKEGILVIDNDCFDDVVWKLERWYGVSIVNQTGLRFHQSFRGEFEREDVQRAIETICVHLNISYAMEKDVIYLKR